MPRLSNRFALPVASVLFVVVFASSGCATRRYARKQAEKVDERVSQVQTQVTQQSGQISTLNTKHDSDISQIKERVETTDQKVEQAKLAIQQANASAMQAKQTADSYQPKIGALANALNFQVVDKSDVQFDSGKSALSPEAKAKLDSVIQKYEGQSRMMIELVGFADPVGSPDFNLDLSEKRAEAVSRYLVSHKIPLISIHVVGLGEESAPDGLESTAQPTATTQDKKQLNAIARRVHVRVYKTGDAPNATVAEVK